MRILISCLVITLLSFGICFAEKYNREKHFGNGWIDTDNNGRDTRQEVLIEESIIPVRFDKNGKVEWGIWICRYTGSIITNPSELDIDHFIPLKEAWISGADKWSQERRIEYANYLADPNHLIAVTAKSNREKGAKNPSDWMPLINRVEYRILWIMIKEKWGLCFDKKEREWFEDTYVRTIFSKNQICEEQ